MVQPITGEPSVLDVVAKVRFFEVKLIDMHNKPNRTTAGCGLKVLVRSVI